MICLTPASLKFSQHHTPFFEQFDDYYHSTVDAVGESQHVFIDGNQLLSRWTNVSGFSIAEIGFCTARNFLIAARHWLESKPDSGVLHYLAIEQQPFNRADLATLFEQRPIDSEIESQLLACYPPAVRGFHRLSLCAGRIQLTLAFDNAQSVLSTIETSVDAWFLDGFAPDKNPAAWEPSLLSEVFRLTVPGGTFSTYSAASSLRNALQQSGFTVQRQRGYAHKREMLAGSKTNNSGLVSSTRKAFRLSAWATLPVANTETQRATVIGAGLAGCSIAYALCQRGWKVHLIEQGDRPGQGASGNPAAVLMPRLSLNHDAQSRLTCSGYLYTLHWLQQLKEIDSTLEWERCGAIQIARDPLQYKRMQKIAAQEEFPFDWLQILSALQTNKISGCDINRPAWYFPAAAWVRPVRVCETLIKACGEHLHIDYNTSIQDIDKNGTDWRLTSSHETTPLSASHVIIANGHSSNQFSQTRSLPLKYKRGQITLIRSDVNTCQPHCIISAEGYITPSIDGYHLIGATFVSHDSDTRLRLTEHEENLRRLKQMIPNFVVPSTQKVQGRAAIRAVSADRLPMVGPFSQRRSFELQFKALAQGNYRSPINAPKYHDGLYLFTGFGSRGLAWIPLCAEYLASMLNHEPLPFDQTLVQAIHPNRFQFRELKSTASGKPLEG